MPYETPVDDCEPTTLRMQPNAYHIHLPLYIMDMIRTFQDHPMYINGIKEQQIIEMLAKEKFACGDLEAQVKTAVLDLVAKGFMRLVNNGYRTLGPIAKLANARNMRNFNSTWKRIAELQNVSSDYVDNSSSSSMMMGNIRNRRHFN